MHNGLMRKEGGEISRRGWKRAGDKEGKESSGVEHSPAVTPGFSRRAKVAQPHPNFQPAGESRTAPFRGRYEQERPEKSRVRKGNLHQSAGLRNCRHFWRLRGGFLPSLPLVPRVFNRAGSSQTRTRRIRRKSRTSQNCRSSRTPGNSRSRTVPRSPRRSPGGRS